MNKPFTPKQTCRVFVLFYALFSAFFIYSYMVNEPISGSFLLMLPTIRNRPITRYIEKGSKVLSTLEPFSIYKLS